MAKSSSTAGAGATASAGASMTPAAQIAATAAVMSALNTSTSTVASGAPTASHAAPTHCAECDEPFSMIFPANKCEQCKRMLCTVCMTETIHIPHASKKKSGIDLLVCDECFFNLRDNTIAIATPEKSWEDRFTMSIPRTWRENIQPLYIYSWLAVVSVVAHALCIAINLLVVGHIGEVEFCGTLFGYFVIYLTIYPLSKAIAAPLENSILVLLKKGNESEASIVLQRGLILATMGGALAALCWQGAGAALHFFGVQYEVAVIARRFLRFYMCGIIQEQSVFLIMIFLHAYCVYSPVALAALIRVPFHIVFVVTLTMHAGMGAAGVALANALSISISLGFLLVLFYRHALGCPEPPRFVWNALDADGLVSHIRHSFSFFVGFFLKSLGDVIPTLLAANMRLDILTAHGSVTLAWTLFAAPAAALQPAVTSRLAAALLLPRPNAAKSLAWLALFASLAYGVASALGVVLMQAPVEYLFTHDARAAAAVRQVSVLAALAMIWSLAQTAAHAVLLALGQARFLAGLHLALVWLLLFPLALFLAVSANLELLGLWWSMIATSAVSALICTSRILALDWAKEGEAAKANQARIDQKQDIDQNEIDIDDVIGPLPHSSRSFSIVDPDIDWDAADDESSHVASVDGLHMPRNIVRTAIEHIRKPVMSEIRMLSESAGVISSAVFLGALQQPRRYEYIMAKAYSQSLGNGETFLRIWAAAAAAFQILRSRLRGDEGQQQQDANRGYARANAIVIDDDLQLDDDEIDFGGVSKSAATPAVAANGGSNGYHHHHHIRHEDIDDLDLDYGNKIENDDDDDEEIAILAGRRHVK